MRRIAVAVVALLALAVGSVGVLARWTASSSDGPVLGPAVLVVSTHTPTSKPAPHPSPTVGPGTSTSIRPPSTAGHAGTSGATQGPVQAATPASPSVVTAPPPSPSYVDDHGGHGDSGKDGSNYGGSNSGGSNSGSGGG